MTKLLKTALKSMRDRQTERKRDRQTQIQRRKRERHLREFTSIMKWFIPNIFKGKEFELIEYVFQVKYMASFIFNCMLLFCLKIIHVELILNGEMFEKKPWWEKISCNFAEFQFNMLHFNIKKGGKLDINVSSSTLIVEQINMFSRKAQTH